MKSCWKGNGNQGYSVDIGQRFTLFKIYEAQKTWTALCSCGLNITTNLAISFSYSL